MKLKKLDIKRITRDLFTGKQSHEAALYAVGIINHMVERANAGDIIFEFEQLVRPQFELRFDEDDNFAELVLRDGENCYVVIVGDVTFGGLIHCTKKNVREYFKLWRVAKIVNVDRVIDLCK